MSDAHKAFGEYCSVCHERWPCAAHLRDTLREAPAASPRTPTPPFTGWECPQCGRLETCPEGQRTHHCAGRTPTPCEGIGTWGHHCAGCRDAARVAAALTALREQWKAESEAWSTGEGIGLVSTARSFQINDMLEELDAVLSLAGTTQEDG